MNALSRIAFAGAFDDDLKDRSVSIKIPSAFSNRALPHPRTWRTIWSLR